MDLTTFPHLNEFIDQLVAKCIRGEADSGDLKGDPVFRRLVKAAADRVEREIATEVSRRENAYYDKQAELAGKGE
jgi:hypothetical protein